MEASGTPGTPPPPPEQSGDAPPPSSPVVQDGEPKATAGWRALAVVLFLALAFACAVMVIAMADIGDTPTCKDALQDPSLLGPDRECFDGSTTQKTISLIFGWPSGILAGVAALVAVFFAATGRRGRLLLTLTGAAIVLGAISILIGSI